MRAAPFDVSDKTHTTSVVLVAWIVQALFCWRTHRLRDTYPKICQLSSNNIYASIVMATKRSKSTNAFAKSCLLLMRCRG